MTENNTKITKPQLIIGAVVLVIILFFVFSKKPATEQAQNLQESNNKVADSFTDKAFWKEFYSPAGKFKATFPIYPTHTSDNIKIPGTGLSIKFDRYSSDVSDGLYAVNTSVYPPEVDIPTPETSLETSLNSMLASSDRFKLISSNLTYNNGYRALDYLITNGEGGYFKGKIVVAGPIVYQVMSSYESKNYNEENYNKFMNSFVIQ